MQTDKLEGVKSANEWMKEMKAGLGLTDDQCPGTEAFIGLIQRDAYLMGGLAVARFPAPEIAIAFSQTIGDHYEMRAFLEAWSHGDISEWQEDFSQWSNKINENPADKDDEYTDLIYKALPIVTGDHATYRRAQKLVGNRHSKSSLVALVNWLLKGQK